jgi:X-Pro dipeptidyl-peptidase
LRPGVKQLVAGALTLATLGLAAGTAQAQGPVLENGKTKAVYDYKTAVRERVFIPQPGIDQDKNGQDDWVTADIIRPAESSATNKMPAIIDPSPYYTTVCRGAEGQCMADWNKDGANDRWPLFYDNYFVPRGYAYVLGQMNGTGYTTNGCPHHGGPGDIAGEKSIVDWLNGRVKAYSAASTTAPEVVATWHNGSSAMIGKSYDGTLSNGVAATGVEGLKTIVPISGISTWYDYSRSGGVRQNTNYPASLNNTVTTGGTGRPPGTEELPDRRTLCNPLWAPFSDDTDLLNGDGDAHGDMNQFWLNRDHVKDASKVKAAVFITHGFQDDNVRMDQVGRYWEALKANGVQTKMWLLRAGHEDPFESRRAVWVDTLHRWFDRHLYAVNNGIQNEPKVTVEDEKDVWGNYADWPVPGTQNVDIYLRSGGEAGSGSLGSYAGGGSTDSLTFTAAASSEATLMNAPSGSQANRRVFLSNPLKSDVRLSGTAAADLAAALGGPASNLSVTIADYGAGTQVSRTSDGVTQATTRTCWGVGTAGDPCEGKALGDSCTAPADQTIEHACYLNPEKPTTDVTSWRVTRGVLDSRNRNSLWYADAKDVVPGELNRYKFPTIPQEHTFKAGHQIGIIVGGTNTSLVSSTGSPNNVAVTLDAKTSKVTLPIVGGQGALAAAGAFSDTTGTVGGTVPATLGLTLGVPASFGAFTPGVTKEYTATTDATVVSTAGNATLSVSEPGFLTNGAFSLAEPLRVELAKSTWTGPTSNEKVGVTFKQLIKDKDPLRTGSYSKTLTYTLSTTQP